MKITIYQINSDRDVNRMLFMAHDSLEKFQGSAEVDSKIYDKIYEKEISCNSLEEVYQIFNLSRPKDFKGHSLSVSDVVGVIGSETVADGFYFCDSFGFKNVPFNPADCGVSDRLNEPFPKITVLLVEPNKYPKLIDIDDSLEAMREVVGGDIEEYMPFDDDIALVCNEEGKIRGLPLNRAVYLESDGRKERIDIVAGKFFICYAPPESENFLSLPDDMAKKYEKMFHYPERFVRDFSGGIIAQPIKPKEKDYER